MNAIRLAILPLTATALVGLNDPVVRDPAVAELGDLFTMPNATLAERNHDDGLRLTGLETGQLWTAQLEPASGLYSPARGLTPEHQWRAMFPRRPDQF